MNTNDQRLDVQIDQLLHAFATTPSPAGLEQRISARLAQGSLATTSRSDRTLSQLLIPKQPSSLLRVFTCATAVLLFAAVGYRALSRPQQHLANTQIAHTPAATPTTLVHPSVRLSQRARPHSATANLMQPAADDPDTIALAETLAPSHPAPTLPLTAQEALLLRATRPGQPIEVAELETRRDAALTALAAAHRRANIREYIQGLLGPLAIAESLSNSSSQASTVASAEPSSSR